MTYKVVSTFKDAETGQVYNVGDSYTNQNETRTASLEAQGFIHAEEELETRETQQAKNQELQDSKKTTYNQRANAVSQEQQQAQTQAQQTEIQQQAQQQAQTTEQQTQARGKTARKAGE